MRSARAACSCAARDLLLLAHALQHDEAAAAGGVEVRPRRVRRRRADDAGNERGLAERELRRRLAEHLPRHRLDAVDAAAQVHAVQIELQDLALGQEDLEHPREHGFLRFASVGPDVGQVQRARELLRDRAAALRAVRAEVVEGRAAQRDRIDSRMQVEAMILDRDHRVLEVGRDLIERHVAPLLVQPEPRPAGGVVEDRVANAAIQPVNGPGVPDRPRAGDRHHDNQADAERDLQPARNGAESAGRRRQSEFGQPHVYEW